MATVDLTSVAMLITDLQWGSVMSFVAWIMIGLVVGLMGSKIINRASHSLARDVLLSIFGAIVGGFLSNLLGEQDTAGLDLYSLVVAAVGAAVFLIAYYGLFRRKFLSMR